MAPAPPVVKVEAEAVRIHRVPVWAAAEPDDPPDVQLTPAVAVTPADDGWVAGGDWGSDWDPATGLVDLVTPPIGPGEAMEVPQGATRAVWARWSVEDETYIVKVAWLHGL